MTSPLLTIATPSSMRRQRLFVAALHGLTLLLLGLHLYVYTLPPTATPLPTAEDAEAAWWGLWPITYAPPWLVVIASPLIIGWIIWWWGRELGIRNYELGITKHATRSTQHESRITNHATRHGQLVIFVITALLLLLSFYLFPIVHTRWGDAYLLAKAIAWPDPALRLTHSWQAPLDVFLHSQLWLQIHSFFGWEDAMPVYRLLSPLAGLLYLLATIGMVRDFMLVSGGVAPGWLTFGLLTSLGVLQLFFGYVENYSFAAAGVLIYLWLGLRTLDGRTPLWLTATMLALTNALHPSTIVLVPSLLYCGWHWLHHSDKLPPINRNKLRLRNVLVGVAAVVLQIVLPMVVVSLAVIGIMEAGGHGLTALMSTDRPGGGDARLFVPLWATTTRWEHYTLFSWLHLRDFLNEQLLVAPIVLPALVILFIIGVVEKIGKQGSSAILGRRDQDTSPSNLKSKIQNPKLLFLFLATFCYLLFVWVWNPDYGGQRDWDLFSLAAIPATVLLAAILPGRFADQRYLQAGTIPLLMLQWLHLGTWLYQNTLQWEWP